jgi:hypothetical protein
MKVNDVLKDIERLKGLELQSIRRGSNIYIEDLNWKNRRISLRNSSGNFLKRSFAEIELLWQALSTHSAIHVDSVLGGGGSSRNQPETILANLPYIEWFKYSGRKHIALINRPSHDLGTLRKMDNVNADCLREEINNVSRNYPQSRLLIVSHNLTETSDVIERITGIKSKAVRNGVYEFSLPSHRLTLVEENSINRTIPVGTYPILTGYVPEPNLVEYFVEINGDNFSVVESAGLIFFCVQGN